MFENASLCLRAKTYNFRFQAHEMNSFYNNINYIRKKFQIKTLAAQSLINKYIN